MERARGGRVGFLGWVTELTPMLRRGVNRRAQGPALPYSTGVVQVQGLPSLLLGRQHPPLSISIEFDLFGVSFRQRL